MLKILNGRQHRSFFTAAEPGGPADLPRYGNKATLAASCKRSTQLLAELNAHWTAIAGFLIVQMLAIVAVYQAHAYFVTSVAQNTPYPASVLSASSDLSRKNLLEQHKHSTGDSMQPGGYHDSNSPLEAKHPWVLGHSSSGRSSSTRTQGPIPGVADTVEVGNGARSGCTVQLDAADETLLRDEIDLLTSSLAEERGWEPAEPDARTAVELQDRVSKHQMFKTLGVKVRGIVDETWGPQTSANTPGVEDVHAELAHYNNAMVEAMTLDVKEAASRQLRTTAADLQLHALDDMAELGSLPDRTRFLNSLYREVRQREQLRVCMVATTQADVWGVRRELLPWMQYHTELGVTQFYLLYDGNDPEAVELLSGVQHLRLMHLHPPWASTRETAMFEFYSRQARQWGGQPGNYELMVKQGYGEQQALRLAEKDGMHWLLHMDSDELLHPGGPSPSITAVLSRQPAHVPAVRFMNFEGQPEAGDLTNRFEQVTLFRVHKHFITPEAHFYRQKYRLGHNAVFLTLYANGKSAVRVGVGARQLGPHFFTANPSPRWQTHGNPRGEWRDVVSDDTVVLHYAYSYMSDVESKANRSCPDSFLQAARAGDRSKIKACFVIDFDQDAYLAAAGGRAAVEDFFFSRMVLSEGSRVKCRDPENGNAEGWCTLHNIDRFKYLMEKVGLMRRIRGPQLIMRSHERAIQASRARSIA